MTRVRGAALVVLTLSLLGRGTVGAQPISGYERSLGRDMLTSVRDHLEKHYYDATFHGIDLRAAAARADSQIRVARSNSEIFTVIAQLVQELDDSHTRFYPPSRAAEVEYGWELQMIGDSCYVVWVKPGSDAAAKGLTVGDRVVAVDGYLPTRRHFFLLGYFLEGLSLRRMVRFVLAESDGSQRTLDIQTKITPRPHIVDLATVIRRIDNAEREWIAEYSRLVDEVLILRLGFFGDPDEIDRVMNPAHGVTTLILDLRGNRGGLESGLVRLVGHLFDRRLVVDTIRRRREIRVVKSKPVRHPFTAQLYVLVDSESASSSEILARLVQLEGRGVVVGDLSAGLVMRSMVYSLSVGTGRTAFYGLSITDADVIMPDGGRLEGNGVQPDALVTPSAADLAAGRDPALAIALKMAGHPMDPAKAGTLLSRRAGHGRLQPR